MKNWRVTKLGVAILLSVMVSVGLANTNSPESIMKNVAAHIIKGLKKHQSQLKSNPKIAFNLVKRYLLPVVDVHNMGASILGRQYWTKASSSQKTAYLHEMKTMVISTYSRAFSSYDNDKVQFFPLRQGEARKRSLELKSQIVRPSGQKISVVYYMHKTHHDWKVYDISIENVSLVQNYRSQFDGVLRQGGVKLLIEKLKAHNKTH